MRQLASIQEIVYVLPIEGAEFIERVGVLGWELVSRKGEFSVGDPCIYIEIDSIVPDVPTFEFLKGSGRWQRIRTKRLRGVVSQGLALPIAKLNDFSYTGPTDIGTDLTEAMGIVKYDPPVFAAGMTRTHGAGYWPGYVPKTDEPRVQSSPKIIEEMTGVPCFITIKLDGTSCTFISYDDKEIVCSRNWALTEDDDSAYSQMAKMLCILPKLKAKGNYAVQGELVGPGIQANKLGLADKDFYAFNVYDIDHGKYLSFNDFVDFCADVGVKTVPILMKDVPFAYSKDEILALAEGKYDGTTNEREGLVIRPMVEMRSEVLKGRMSFKAISNAFLLKNKE